MTMPTYFEAAGLLAASVAWVFVARARHAIPASARLVLFGLLGVLLIGHLVNILEWSGVSWADTIGDQLSIVVPLLWGLFLLEIGRSYLTAQVDASTEQLRFFLEKVPVAVACLQRGLVPASLQPHLEPHPPRVELRDSAVAGTPGAVAWARARDRALDRASGARPVPPKNPPRTRKGGRTTTAGRSGGSATPIINVRSVLVMLEETTSSDQAEASRALAAEELGRAQRLAHVGQLAAGAAHDFNNLLYVIQMARDRAQQRPSFRGGGSRASVRHQDGERADQVHAPVRQGGYRQPFGHRSPRHSCSTCRAY